MGGANPVSLIGSKPLLNGKKAPPHPPIAPHMIGPKTAKSNSLGAIAFCAAYVNFTTTDGKRTFFIVRVVEDDEDKG